MATHMSIHMYVDTHVDTTTGNIVSLHISMYDIDGVYWTSLQRHTREYCTNEDIPSVDPIEASIEHSMEYLMEHSTEHSIGRRWNVR